MSLSLIFPGVNTVLRSLKLTPGDAVLATSLTYGSLKNLFRDFEENICPGEMNC